MWVIEEEKAKKVLLVSFGFLFYCDFHPSFFEAECKKSRGQYFEKSPLENGVIIIILFVDKNDLVYVCVSTCLSFVVIVQFAFPSLKFLHILW